MEKEVTILIQQSDDHPYWMRSVTVGNQTVDCEARHVGAIVQVMLEQRALRLQQETRGMK